MPGGVPGSHEGAGRSGAGIETDKKCGQPSRRNLSSGETARFVHIIGYPMVRRSIV